MAGGALGSALRFVIGDAMIQRFGQGFPWGTLSANFIGAFAAGYLLVWLQQRGGNVTLLRAFLVIGLLGGLTTFSSLMLETLVFARSDRGGMVPLYLGVSLVGGLLLVWLGARLAEAAR
ncbi:MAG: fluoride efflux transporter CrcB [Stenotrophomonas sp.]|nr:fluoride efflux transporter CrcB [Stenotrophomonas sp.]